VEQVEMPGSRDRTAAAVAIEGLLESGTLTFLNDEELLLHFRVRADRRALEALVERYGPLVLSVCREILADPNDIDDAFQATFLVLIRKSGSIRRPGSLAAWLHGVAYRVALRTKQMVRPLSLTDEPAAPNDACPTADREQSELLHRELDRLPQKYKLPIVLCYFQGLTQDDAARQLRWPLGTVRGRLSRARDRLRDRLSRYGSSPAVGFTSNLDALCKKWISPSENLTHAVLGLVNSNIPSRVTAINQGVLVAMLTEKLKWIMLTFAAASVVLLAAGSSMLAQSGPKQDAESLKRSLPAGTAESKEVLKSLQPLESPAATAEELADKQEMMRVETEIFEMEAEAMKRAVSSPITSINSGESGLGRTAAATKYLDENRKQLADLESTYMQKRLKLGRPKRQLAREADHGAKAVNRNAVIAELSQRLRAVESRVDRIIQSLEKRDR
jgi:RNA polymerase sigma factor (sigma-70 family)